jgi:hypothetical protein
MVFAKPSWRDYAADNSLAWIIWPIASLVLFFGFWNKYDDLSGFQTMPFLALLAFGGIPFIIIMKNRMLRLPGRALWRSFLLCGASFNDKIKRFEVSQFYFEAAHISMEERA